MALSLLVDENSTTFIFSGLVNGLEKFKNSADPFVNDAIGTIQLRDSTDSTNVGPLLTWTHITGSSGDYYAQLAAGQITEPGVTYKARVRMTSPTGLELDGIYDVVAVERTKHGQTYDFR